MPFYEVIYETGAYSVMQADSDEEALAGIRAHHSRATSGERGGPSGHPAERVVKVLCYDEHPANYNLTQTLSTTELAGAVEVFAKERAVAGDVSLTEVASHVRALADPLVPDSAPHDSNYKMKETKELKGWDK